MTGVLRCYVCGKPCLVRFVIVSAATETDRPFLLHEGSCFERAESELKTVVYAKRTH